MRVLYAATCDRLRIMRAEGTFNLDRFDAGPDGGHSYTLDYEL
jgi:hypothetical protein